MASSNLSYESLNAAVKSSFNHINMLVFVNNEFAV